jgi:hypothetical protein
MDDQERTQAASLTDQLYEDLEQQPTMSRRERRALAAAQQKEKGEDDLPAVDEPTALFTMSRKHEDEEKPVRAGRVEDEDDEGEDDVKPVKVRKARKAKKPAYEEDDGDDEDEDEKPARKKERKVYQEDEDDEDEDDLEMDEYDDDDESMGFGKRLLAFLKGLIVIALILLLSILALRVAEANHQISLDGVRNTVGGVVPFVNQIFPEPAKEEAPVTITQADDAQDEAQDTAQDAGEAADQNETDAGAEG